MGEIGGVFLKGWTAFSGDRYIGGRVEIIGSKFFADAFDREVRKARLRHPEVELHLEIIRDDQIILTFGESLALVQSVIFAEDDDSQDRPIVTGELVGTGTGFAVSSNYLVTAEHVVEDCNAVTLLMGDDEIDGEVVSVDKVNDLALLRIRIPSSSQARLRDSPLRLGEAAINFGFPLVGVLSPNPQITAGHVSSLAGIENNYAFLQYSAPTQFGNSGGPVLDASGNVIGVVSAKLNDAKTQNVNFATKAIILADFLRANRVPFEKADLTEELKLPDIAEKAETFTVLVGCWE